MPALDSPAMLQAMKVLYYVAQSSVVVPVAIGFWRRHVLSPALRMIFYCCLMWLVLGAFAEYAQKVWQYNIAIYDAVDILEMWLVGIAYHRALRFRFRRHFLLIGVLYTIFALLDAFVLHGLWKPITYTIVLRSALTISLIMLYFEQILRELRNIRLELEPLFVASVGLLLYDACSVYMFILRNNETNTIINQQIESVNSFLSLLLYGLLARAFWLAGMEQEAALDLASVSGKSAFR